MKKKKASSSQESRIFNKRSAVRLALSLLVFSPFLLHLTGFGRLPLINRMENLVYDLRLNLTMPDTTDNRIAILDIDERSLEQVGQWPWGRNTMARLVEQVFGHYQAEILAFDVLFAEPDQSSGLHVLDRLADGELKSDRRYRQALSSIRSELEYDQLFANSIRGRKVVLGYVYQHENPVRVNALPEPAVDLSQSELTRVPFVRAVGYTGNLERFQHETPFAGFFNNSLVDSDGVFRRVPLVVRIDDQLYESLSLATARAVLGSPPVELVINSTRSQAGDELGLEWLRIDRAQIPVDERGAALVPYRGFQGSFPYVSAVDVLQGRVSKASLAGKIVFVGTTAPGLLDLRTAPFQSSYAGVEIHANLVSGILDGRIKHRPAYTTAIEILMLLVGWLLLTFAYIRFQPVGATIVTATTAAALTGFNVYMWQAQNLVLPLYSPLLLIAILFFVHMTYGLFVESRGKRQIKQLFGQYVPPEVVEEMSENPGNFSYEGEKRDMTVLFSDVRSFTTISEGMDPKELTRLMNAYMTPMTRIIHDKRGTVDKYIGDAIMAFWGAPLMDEEHARHAVDAALQMMRELKLLQKEFAARGWPEIRIGVGLNSGEMNVGNMGSEFRTAYTVLGDAVNLGSRLEGLTKTYGVDVLVSEFTRMRVPDYPFLELDRVRVKGKDKPVAIFAPLESNSPESRRAMELVDTAIRAYRHQQWDDAQRWFKDVSRMDGLETLARLYQQRILHYQQNPPSKQWDGVFTFTTK